jgi:type II secretion system protein H
MSLRRARGFTLLELLVVIVIIGIVISGTLLALGATGQDRGLQEERDRLTALVDYVRDRGALMTTEYGILCGQHGYRFVYYDDRTMQWAPETLDDTLRERKLPDGLSLQLIVEGRTVLLDDAALQIPPSAGSLAALGGNTAGSASAAGGASVSGASDSQLGAPGAQSNAPQIMLLSNGDTNAFELTILRDSANRRVTLKSASDGTISAGDIVDAPQ